MYRDMYTVLYCTVLYCTVITVQYCTLYYSASTLPNTLRTAIAILHTISKPLVLISKHMTYSPTQIRTQTSNVGLTDRITKKGSRKCSSVAPHFVCTRCMQGATSNYVQSTMVIYSSWHTMYRKQVELWNCPTLTDRTRNSSKSTQTRDRCTRLLYHTNAHAS
jgi:hypothetical protein